MRLQFSFEILSRPPASASRLCVSVLAGTLQPLIFSSERIFPDYRNNRRSVLLRWCAFVFKRGELLLVFPQHPQFRVLSTLIRHAVLCFLLRLIWSKCCVFTFKVMFHVLVLKCICVFTKVKKWCAQCQNLSQLVFKTVIYIEKPR